MHAPTGDRSVHAACWRLQHTCMGLWAVCGPVLDVYGQQASVWLTRDGGFSVVAPWV